MLNLSPATIPPRPTVTFNLHDLKLNYILAEGNYLILKTWNNKHSRQRVAKKKLVVIQP